MSSASCTQSINLSNGTLTVRYATEKGVKSVQFKDQENVITEIAIKAIWINDFPFQSLLFEKYRFPENISVLIFYNNCFITTLSPAENHIPGKFTLSIHYRSETLHRSKTLYLEVTQTCQIKQLKILVLKILKKISNLPLKDYLLFYQGYQLEERYTLGECGLNPECTNFNLEFMYIDDTELSRSKSLLQMGTDYHSGSKEFSTFLTSMNKRLNTVCKIRRPARDGSNEFRVGTGFLVGEDLIMTNAHVMADYKDSEGAVAIFFYEEKVGSGYKNSDSLTVSLVEVVCDSPAGKMPTVQCLDYSIVRFNYNMASPYKSLCLYFESLKVKHFLEEEMLAALNYSEEKIMQETTEIKNQHANIIHYPEKEAKKISFRKNRIQSMVGFRIHYQTDTNSGSSGALVMNDQGKWLGLHYAACQEIEFELIEKIDLLLDKLELINRTCNLDEFHYTFNEKGYETLKVWYETGQWKLGTGEKTHLLELIELKLSSTLKEKNISAREWAYNFLKEHNADIDKEHIQCNTAIIARHILKDLNLPEKRKKLIPKCYTLTSLWPAYLLGGALLCFYLNKYLRKK